MDSLFAKLLNGIEYEGKPTSEVQAMGLLMQNWLKTEMADAGTEIDSGAGMHSYDLWVKFGGVELFINIQKSGAQLAKETA